jgi:hypothetical protein
VDDNSIAAGDCTTLRVHIEYVQAADLSGAEYSKSGVTGPNWSGPTCPDSTTTYTLHVIKRDGSTEDRTVTVTVIDTTGPDISGLKASEDPIYNNKCSSCPCETDVDVNVTDPSGVAEVRLVYIRPGETTKRTKLMANVGGTSYRTTLDAATWPDRGTLEFYVQAYDSRGNPSESLHLKIDVKACVT